MLLFPDIRDQRFLRCPPGANGHNRLLYPQRATCVAEGGLPKAIFDRLYTESRPNFAPAYYGKLRITARFDYGSTYGHLGGFRYQIVISAIQPQVELVPWSPQSTTTK